MALHLAIYRTRDDVHSIVHTHSVYATAWSFRAEPLALGTEDLVRAVGGEVRVTDAAPAGSDELADQVVEALRDRSAVLLARHGVVGVGSSAREALDVCRVVEHQAHIAWLLSGVGTRGC
jgi:L-fuculose-phosphate aldolase